MWVDWAAKFWHFEIFMWQNVLKIVFVGYFQMAGVPLTRLHRKFAKIEISKTLSTLLTLSVLVLLAVTLTRV